MYVVFFVLLGSITVSSFLSAYYLRRIWQHCDDHCINCFLSESMEV